MDTPLVVWLAYILSQGDHRMNSVQGWVAGVLTTLKICPGLMGLRELDFSDDRLCLVLDCLGRNDAAWVGLDRALFDYLSKSWGRIRVIGF